MSRKPAGIYTTQKMMRKKRRLILKYLLLISVLMLMMLLCACRVRLTNNTEVASTIEDEDGWLLESYQMRRDQLGAPVAERPIFKGFDSGSDEEDYSDIEHEPLDYDQGTIDEWDEPEDTSDSSSTTRPSRNSSGNSSGGSSEDSSDSETGSDSDSGSGDDSSSGSGTPAEEPAPQEEEPPRKEEDPVTEIIVEFDTNGGYFDKEPYSKRPYMKAVSGSTYGELPAPVSDDKSLFFIGWFTEKDGGTLITRDSTVESEEPLTLYAHWGKNYSFTLKTDGGMIDPKEVKKTSENGLYPALPVPVKNGFHFMGWYLEKDKTRVETGQECKSDQALVAHWVENGKYWEDRYAVASNNEAFTDTFTADDGSIAKGAAPKDGEKPSFRIVKCDGEYNETNAAKAKDGNYNKAVLVVPANIYDSDNSKRLYRLILLKQMYGDASTISDDEIKQAAAELGITLTEPPLYRFDAGQPEQAAQSEEPAA